MKESKDRKLGTLRVMKILDLIFPKTCAGCSKKGIYFCPDCLAKIKKASQVCPVCERQSPFGQTHHYCLNRFTLNGLFFFFTYEGIIREAIHQLKYKYVTDLEEEFWEIIKKQMEDLNEKMIVLKQFMERENLVVVPIPLHWYRQNLRGFNQSSLFAKRLCNHFNLRFSDKILVRRKNVPSQTKLTRKEREKNVKGIFSINSVSLRAIQEHDEAILVILVDDVWTTGSTMKEAARVLKGAGIKKVWGITIAR